MIIWNLHLHIYAGSVRVRVNSGGTLALVLTCPPILVDQILFNQLKQTFFLTFASGLIFGETLAWLKVR